MKHVRPFEGRPNGPNVSAPERAFLELLSEVGVQQPLAETRDLAESTSGLRASVLSELLRDCTNVKTVRLRLQLERELSVPWAKKLDPVGLPNQRRPACLEKVNDIYLKTARLLVLVRRTPSLTSCPW